MWWTYSVPEDFDFRCSEMELEKTLYLMEVDLHLLRVVETRVFELTVEFQDGEAVRIERKIVFGASDVRDGDWLHFLHLHVGLGDIDGTGCESERVRLLVSIGRVFLEEVYRRFHVLQNHAGRSYLKVHCCARLPVSPDG